MVAPPRNSSARSSLARSPALLTCVLVLFVVLLRYETAALGGGAATVVGAGQQSAGAGQQIPAVGASPPPPPPPPAARFAEPSVDEATATIVVPRHTQSAACATPRLRKLLGASCGSAAAAAADEAHDSAAVQAYLRGRQHEGCAGVTKVREFRDWRNGFGAQLSSLVGAWAAQLQQDLDDDGAHTLLVAHGGMRYANKRLCPARDLSCYFEPFSGCGDAVAAAERPLKEARTKKTPPGLAAALGAKLGLRRPRDTWWLRKELTRYIFRPNANTTAMLGRVRREMALPGDASARLLALHVRRGDKRDLGAKERGEPFSDAMYVAAARALADEMGASGVLTPEQVQLGRQQVLTSHGLAHDAYVDAGGGGGARAAPDPLPRAISMQNRINSGQSPRVDTTDVGIEPITMASAAAAGGRGVGRAGVGAGADHQDWPNQAMA